MAEEISRKELKNLQLKILDHVDAFCHEHQIHYSLSSGTLLGAVRHGGYIPWDDDIDIMMLREDYEKFRACYLANNKNERYQLVDHVTQKKYCLPFMKIHDTDTLIREDWQFTDLGINIDIFPIDAIPHNKFIAYSFFVIISVFYCLNIWGRSRYKKRSFLKKSIAWCVFVLFPPVLNCCFCNAVLKMTNKFRSQSVANLYFWQYKQKRVPVEIFKNLMEIKFENRYYKALKDYDVYLSSIYGDYMTPPPKSARLGIHNITPKWR